MKAHAAGVTLPYGGGISAMPSLHVAMAALYAAVGWRVNRLAGLLLCIYVLIVQLGAVHLGWHYLVDGLAGIALGWLFWVIAWRFAGRWLRGTVPPAVAPRSCIFLLW